MSDSNYKDKDVIEINPSTCCMQIFHGVDGKVTD